MPRGRPRRELVLKVHNATGVYYVRSPETHREKYFTKDRDESQSLLEQWLLDRARQAERNRAAQDAQIIPPPRGQGQELVLTTVADVFNLYLDWLYRRSKFRSYKDTRRVAKHFGKSVPLQTRLDNLSKKDFRGYRDALWEEVEQKNRRRSFANRPIRILRAAFRKAYRESDHMVNGEAVCAMLSVLETRRERDATGATAITPTEFRALAGADDAQWKAIMYLAINCALGNTDIARLEHGHIDLDAGMMNFARPKTEDAADRPRYTPLWPETVGALKAHVATTRSQKLVFTTVRGNPWVRYTAKVSNDELAKKFSKLVKTVKIPRPGLSFYSIRHAAAEWAADTPGVDTLGVKFLLGHATAEMWGKYVTRTPDRLQKAVEGIRRQLFSCPAPNGQESSADSPKVAPSSPGPSPSNPGPRSIGNPAATQE
jgi:integrase